MRFVTIKCHPDAKEDLDIQGLKYDTEANYLSLNYCEVDRLDDDQLIEELELNPDHVLSIS